VRAFAESVRENDEMFTIVFNEHVRRGLPASVGFTRSRDQLLAALAVRAPGGLTAVHDAVIEGLSHLTTSSNQKRVLVVLSDGKDNASRLSESNMLYRASQSSAIIYTIWTGDLAQDRGNAGLLKRLARETGGVAYQPKSERDVVDAFGEVAGTIRRSYTIGYTPTNSTADGSYRQVRVDVHTGGRRLTTRARQGYIAPDDNEPRTSAQQP
jgi:Ca-activated chloride channel family protein